MKPRRLAARRTLAALLLALAAAAGSCASGRAAAADAESARGAACRAEPPGDGGTRAERVRWVLPAGDRAVLDAWCGAVGSPVSLHAATAGPAAVDSVAIVSWNTHVGGGDVRRLAADLRAGRLTGGAPVRDFVLLLQEVHRAGGDVPASAPAGGVPSRVEERPEGGERIDVVEAARELGLSLLYVPSMRNGRAPAGGVREDRGNAILSSLPLHDPRAVELPFEAQRRVAVAATIRGATADGAPWELLVASAHLDTRSTGSRLWATFGSGRLRQARALVRGLPAGPPAVVAGDLNTWSLGFLEGAVPFLRSAFPQTPCPTGEATFATGWGLRRTLDHVFFRLPPGWSARERRIDDRYGSDHFPLLAWAGVGAGPAHEAGCGRTTP